MTAALYIVIVAMLFQQAMSYMAAQVLPSAAPQVGEALGLAADLVLYHTALFYAVSGIFQSERWRADYPLGRYTGQPNFADHAGRWAHAKHGW